MKLEGAFKAYDLDVSGKIALDLGASTGGFTDCMLKRGAEKVYAVDVGTNQLVYQLRIHPKVVSLEKTHARKLSRDNIPQAIEFLTVDVSFTSLTYVLPRFYHFWHQLPQAFSSSSPSLRHRERR